MCGGEDFYHKCVELINSNNTDTHTNIFEKIKYKDIDYILSNYTFINNIRPYYVKIGEHNRKIKCYIDNTEIEMNVNTDELAFINNISIQL